MNLEELTRTIAETLEARVLALWGVPVDRVVLQTPPRLEMGDLATPLALELARRLKRAPRDIARELAEKLTLPPLVASVTRPVIAPDCAASAAAASGSAASASKVVDSSRRTRNRNIAHLGRKKETVGPRHAGWPASRTSS